MGNMFCGYACVVYAMRGDSKPPRRFIGIAIVLDMLDGRIARLTGTASDFGVRVRLAGRRDLVRHGAGDPVVRLGAAAARPARVGGRLLFVSAAALRLARFNIQSAAGGDKRYFVGMPSPPAAGDRRRRRSTRIPYGLHDYRAALPGAGDGARARRC